MAAFLPSEPKHGGQHEAPSHTKKIQNVFLIPGNLEFEFMQSVFVTPA